MKSKESRVSRRQFLREASLSGAANWRSTSPGAVAISSLSASESTVTGAAAPRGSGSGAAPLSFRQPVT